MKKANWKNSIIIVLVFGLLGYLGYAFYDFSTKKPEKYDSNIIIRIVDKDKYQFITTKDIENSLERNNISIKSKTVKDINTNQIEKIIRNNPIVKKVECYKTPSGLIKIDVWQRSPIFRVIGTINYYVDEGGIVMPTTPNFTAYVPIVTGQVNKQFATHELYKFVLFLRDNKFWNAQIEQIHVEANNEIILIPRVGDHEIILGNLTGFEQKLERLKTMYKNGFSKIGWGDYQSINLKYGNQVVCTKKNIGEK